MMNIFVWENNHSLVNIDKYNLAIRTHNAYAIGGKRECGVGGIMNSRSQTIGKLPTAHYQSTVGDSTYLRNFTLDSN